MTGGAFLLPLLILGANVTVDAQNAGRRAIPADLPVCFERLEGGRKADAPLSTAWTPSERLTEACADTASMHLTMGDESDKSDPCHLLEIDWRVRPQGKLFRKEVRIHVLERDKPLHTIVARLDGASDKFSDDDAHALCRGAFLAFGTTRKGKVYGPEAKDEDEDEYVREWKKDDPRFTMAPVKQSSPLFLEAGVNLGGPVLSAGGTLVLGAFSGGFVWAAGGKALAGYQIAPKAGTSLVLSSQYTIYRSGSYTETDTQRFSLHGIGIRQYVGPRPLYGEVTLVRAFARHNHSGSEYSPYASEDDEIESYHRCEKASSYGVTLSSGGDFGQLSHSKIGVRFEALSVYVPVGRSQARNCEPTRAEDDYRDVLAKAQIVAFTQLSLVFSP